MGKKITLKEFWNSKEKLAIRCNTLEKAKKLLETFNKMGKKWQSGDSYLGTTYWGVHKEKTCYCNSHRWGDVNTYRKLKYKIFKFEDVIFEEEKTTINKKLRDLTLEEFNNWREENCYKTPCEKCPFVGVNCDSDGNFIWIKHKELFSNTFLNQEVEIEDFILNDKEKEYLRAVIKPFRDRVENIQKNTVFYDKEGLLIKVKFKQDLYTYANLPPFEKNTMYKNMQINKKYTLEELGL